MGEIKLKANEVLFEEGDQSKSLYFLKRGVIRIYKKKGSGSIEIESIRAGQILGELAFFDNNPRSASAEALTAAELVEISKDALDEAVSKVPEWFSALIKTITARLRTTNNRLRALESVSTDYETDKHGNRSREFTYANTSELLRFCTALLAISARYGKMSPAGGIQFSQPLLEKFASQILQVPVSKVFSLIETFRKVHIVSDDSRLLDIKYLDYLIQYLNDQNLLEPSKKRTLSETAFKVMQLVVQHKATAIKLSETMEQVNISPHLASSALSLSQAQELFDRSFIHAINVVSGDEAYIQYEPVKFMKEYQVCLLLSEMAKLNEEKRKA